MSTSTGGHGGHGGHGGARPGAGRKAGKGRDPSELRSIVVPCRLTLAEREKAKTLGGGNISRGLRLALELFEPT
jgi:hypothetical protein